MPINGGDGGGVGSMAVIAQERERKKGLPEKAAHGVLDGYPDLR